MNDEHYKDVKSDLAFIRDHLIELVKQGAVHNQILSQHEKRSTNLEERFKPIESTWLFVSKVSAVAIAVGGMASAYLAVIKLLQ